MKVGAVEDAESFADIAEADAFDVDLGHFFFGDADAVVFDFDVQAAVAIGGAELDFAAVEFWSEAVFQTVFDDGLEKHAGDEGFERLFVDLLDDVEVVLAEAGDFNIEIVVDEFELFAQRHEGLVLAKETPQDVAELEDYFARVIRIETDEGGDGVQRIEKEVWVDLAGERVHARFEEELLVTLEIHFDARVVPDFQRRGDGHQRSDHGQDKPPVPLRMNRKEPLGLGGVHQGNTAKLQSDAHSQRRHFPGELAFFQKTNHCFRNV